MNVLPHTRSVKLVQEIQGPLRQGERQLLRPLGTRNTRSHSDVIFIVLSPKQKSKEKLLVAGTSSQAMWNSGRPWLISVIVLCLPILLFVSLHLFDVYAPGCLPEFLSLPVAWVESLTGMFGGLTTIAASVVTVAATFQRRVSVNVKVILWSFIVVSVLACWCGSYIPT